MADRSDKPTGHSLEIIQSPGSYLDYKKLSLEERIKDVSLPEGTEENIASDKAKRVVRDRLLGLFRVGEIVKEILDWNENVDNDIKQAKKDYLISEYIEKSNSNEMAITSLKKLLTDPYGNTIFNKIINILNDSPPDPLLLEQLASALRYIVNSRFQDLFEEHKYALSQIEQLTPQALAILSDEDGWPGMNLGSYTSNGGRITSDWLHEFTKSYTSAKGIHDQKVQMRVQHAINELIRSRMIEANLSRERFAVCSATEIGKSLIPYLSGTD